MGRNSQRVLFKIKNTDKPNNYKLYNENYTEIIDNFEPS